jgi:hypothetical protein
MINIIIKTIEIESGVLRMVMKPKVGFLILLWNKVGVAHLEPGFM